MPAPNVENPPMSEARHRATFFRQSGWLMIANIVGGLLMYGVHFLNIRLPTGEYGSFGALLAVVMVLPTIPLQMVLAQQTAKALATNREGELSGMIRLAFLVTTALWLVAAGVVLAFQNTILQRWGMSSPAGLWITLLIVLFSIWLPILWGVLQGQQNFLWLGWSMLSNGIGRVGLAAVAVLVFHFYAAGMMGGVLFGVVAATFIGAWQTRRLWLAPAQPFDWRSLFHQILPLALGFLGFQILLTADTMFVKSYFNAADADLYVSRGTMSRALMWLVLPLASVMFPRLVHSTAKGEKSNLMGMVLMGTALLAVVGAAGLSLVGPWVVALVFPHFVGAGPEILPWYAAAMVPLAVGNVLLNNLLARPASKLVPALCVLGVAVAYLFAITRFHASLTMVLQVLGLSNLLLLAVCAWFTWGVKAKSLPLQDQPVC